MIVFYASISQLGSAQQAVLLIWTALVAVLVVVGLVAAATKVSWWGKDHLIGWFELIVLGVIGFLPLISNVMAT